MTVWTVPARLVRVVDGDTIVLDLDLGWRVWRLGERCRLAGINAPELNTPEGLTARDWVTLLLAGSPPEMFTSRALDKYGRPLGTVRLTDGRILNDLILSVGHAVPASG